MSSTAKTPADVSNKGETKAEDTETKTTITVPKFTAYKREIFSAVGGLLLGIVGTVVVLRRRQIEEELEELSA